MATTNTIAGTDANGYSINVPAPSGIPVSQITPTSPMDIAPVKDSTNYLGIVNNIGTTLATNEAQRQADLATQNEAQAYKQGQSLSDMLAGLQGGHTKDVAGTYAQQGVNDQFNILKDLQAQSVGLQNEAQAIPIQLQQDAIGKGRGETAMLAIQDSKLRENALKALSLGQQYAIASGNYEKAKNYADQLIESKYAQEEARINAYKTQLESLNNYTLSPAQKKQQEAQSNLIRKQEQELADKKANEQATSKLLIDASPVAPPDVLQRAKDIQAKGGTATEVAMALGKYGGDYLANEKLKAELVKIKAETNKIYSDQAAVQATQQTPEVSAWVSNIQNGKAKLSDVPQKLKSAVSVGLSTATTSGIADNAKIQGLKETSNNIQSLLDSNGLSLAVGTAPLGRQDVLQGFRSDRQDFVAGIEQLLAGKTLDALINLKAQGGTLGALSEQEGQMMRSAASKIGAWRKVDPKTGDISFNTSEASFKKELETLKRLTDKAITNAGGSTLVSSGNPVADSYITKSMQSLQSSQVMTPAVEAGYVDNQNK